MNQLAEQKIYWIISFSLYDAHIVETKLGESYNEPLRTFRVDYEDLKYKHMDDAEIVQRARRDAKARKEQLDPRIVFNPNNSIEYLLSLPPLNERDDKESFALTLSALRDLPEDSKNESIERYDNDQRMKEDELCLQIYHELEKKRDYFPKEIGNLTQGELLLGLPQAGYLTGAIEFTTLDEALYALYHKWVEIWNNDKKIKFMEELGQLSFNVAHDRMSKIFDSI